MRRFLLIFQVIIMCTVLSASAQRVTLNASQVKLESVFTSITKQTGLTFAYSQPTVDPNRIVSIKVDDTELATALTQLFTGTQIAFEISADKIYLFEKGTASPSNAKITIRGVVADENGQPLIGASIVEKGTVNGITAGADGGFVITAAKNAVLSVSYLGYTSEQVAVNGRTAINIVLSSESVTMGEVVVTALGIKKKEKSLTYSTQIVGGDELTRTKDPNMITALAGKTAGVQISKSSSGLGGSAKVIIRGNRSASGNNQPLYVIDGIPINSAVNDQTATSIGGTNDAGNRDGGDGISNLNPDDIESMNILKGPSAAALYGSQAANGVVVITTKKGRAGVASVNFSSNTTIETAAYGIPDFQNAYTGVTSSWGSAINGSPDYVKDFFQSGVTTINSVSLSRGTDKMLTYFSYANTYGRGIVEKNELNKHNFNFRETANFLNDKLVLDANVNLMHQKLDNATTPGGYYMNPLVGLYHFPRGGVEGGQSFDHYKKEYAIFNTERNLYVQNWYAGGSDMDQNPYWLINKTPSESLRNRTIANLSLSYQITEALSVQLRGNADFISDKYNQKMYVGTHQNLAGQNGRFIKTEATHLNTYADLLITYQSNLGKDFYLSANLGGSVTDTRTKDSYLDSRPGSLFFPNVFTIANMNLNGGYILPDHDTRVQTQSVFFAGQLGFRDYLYLDLTARNDWTSTLAFTDSFNKGFFYPSVGLTFVVTDAFKLPEAISFGKVRGSWAQVGNGLPAFVSRMPMYIAAGGTLQNIKYQPFKKLKPELTKSWEFGTEWRFFGSRLEFDFTYYKTNTENQLFTLPAPAGSGYSFYYVNAGNIENKGVEIVLGGTPVMTNDFSWKTNFNFGKNKNKVIELAEGLSNYPFGQLGSNSYQMRLEKGGAFGDIYGTMFARNENGEIQYGTDGLPMKDDGDFKKIANCSPDFTLGWANTFKYKNLSLYFLIDGRFGGKVLSMTQADLDQYGVSKRTGKDRKRGHVNFDGRQIDNIQGFYAAVGGRSGITEHYVYSATNIRLRELSLGYSLPAKWFEGKLLKGCEIAFIGRNLFFFKNDAPYDPDASLSTGNNLQGIDVFGMPSLRSFGFNLKLKF